MKRIVLFLLTNIAIIPRFDLGKTSTEIREGQGLCCDVTTDHPTKIT